MRAKLIDGWVYKNHKPENNERFLIANDLKPFFGLKPLEYRLEGTELSCRWIADSQDLCVMGENRWNTSDQFLIDHRDFFIHMVAYDIFLGYMDRWGNNIVVNKSLWLIDDSINFNYWVGTQLPSTLLPLLGLADQDYQQVIGLLEKISLEEVSKVVRRYSTKNVLKYMEFFRTRLKDSQRLVRHYRLSIEDRKHYTFLRSKKFYQSIQLVDGEIHGNYPTEDEFLCYKSQLPDVTGMSALDIGCNLGVFCTMLKRQGCSRVVGIDKQKYHLTKAKYLNERYEFGIDYEEKNIEDYMKTGQAFDIILFLSVLHHQHNQLRVMTWIRDMAKKYVFLEVLIKTDGKEVEMLQDGIKQFKHYPSIACLERFFEGWGITRIPSRKVVGGTRTFLIFERRHK